MPHGNVQKENNQNPAQFPSDELTAFNQLNTHGWHSDELICHLPGVKGILNPDLNRRILKSAKTVIYDSIPPPLIALSHYFIEAIIRIL
ncbi:MAG: hypothetical protein ABWZ79_17810 [Pedobacter agri]